MATAGKTRREAGAWLLKAGWWALGGTGLLSIVASVRFMFPKALFEPPVRFIAGRPADFAIDAVSERFADSQRVWIVRDAKGIYALLAQCTHLGCMPRWFGEAGRFKCPCHGSNFDREGQVLFGPAPKPLRRASIRLTRKGRIEVNRGLLADFDEANRRPEFRIAAEQIKNA